MSQLLVMLQIGGCRAALWALDIQSVIELEHVYPVPRAPAFIAGLTAMRSQSLTVIDTRISVGLSDYPPAGERAVVTEMDGNLYALIVDAIFDVAEAQSEPAMIPGGYGAAWERVAKGMVETDSGPALLLDIKSLINGPTAIAA